MIKRIVVAFLRIFDIFYLPIVMSAAIVLKIYRKLGNKNLPKNTKVIYRS
jgi:hypothetical protein